MPARRHPCHLPPAWLPCFPTLAGFTFFHSGLGHRTDGPVSLTCGTTELPCSYLCRFCIQLRRAAVTRFARTTTAAPQLHLPFYHHQPLCGGGKQAGANALDVVSITGCWFPPLRHLLHSRSGRKTFRCRVGRPLRARTLAPITARALSCTRRLPAATNRSAWPLLFLSVRVIQFKFRTSFGPYICDDNLPFGLTTWNDGRRVC